MKRRRAGTWHDRPSGQVAPRIAMTGKLTDAMLRILRQIDDANDPNGVRADHDQIGKALLLRGLVQKITRPDSPWNFYRVTPQGDVALKMARLSDMIIAGASREECQRALGVTEGVYFYQARKLRRSGDAPYRNEVSGDAWAADRAKCGVGPVVGSRADLLDSIGLDLLMSIAAECPPGVTLMTWIAGIVKDSMNDDAVPPAASTVCQLDLGASGRASEA